MNLRGKCPKKHRLSCRYVVVAGAQSSCQHCCSTVCWVMWMVGPVGASLLWIKKSMILSHKLCVLALLHVKRCEVPFFEEETHLKKWTCVRWCVRLQVLRYTAYCAVTEELEEVWYNNRYLCFPHLYNCCQQQLFHALMHYNTWILYWLYCIPL